MRPPLRDIDYTLLTAETVRTDTTRAAFYALSAVFAMAGLERLAVMLLWDAFPDEHDQYPLHVLLSIARGSAHKAQAGTLPIPVPPEEYAGEPGFFLSAYDLYHHPTPEIYETLADILQQAGYPDLADLVIAEMPAAIAKAGALAA